MLRYCPDCAQDRVVEAPQCGDGHGERCPELMCQTCAAALFQAVPMARSRSSLVPRSLASRAIA